jgi:hypothetical protein
MSIEENRQRYEGSGLEALIKSSDHEICERCYCCDSVWESSPCWQCGGFEWDDEDDYPCSVCGGEGELTYKSCLGNCDEQGDHPKNEEHK